MTRMYLLVRDDLAHVPVGKMLGQAGHAFAHALFRAPYEIAAAYDAEPEHVKIVLRCTAAEMAQTEALCLMWTLPHHQQIDLAKTFFPEPTPTCLAIGPIGVEYYGLLALKQFKLF